MRCNPRRWILGLLPLSAFILLINWIERPKIEAELSQEARHDLDRRGLDWARVDFKDRGRNGLLTGEALSQAERKEASDIALNVYGVRSLDDRLTIAEVATYRWSATRDGGGIALTGLVPTEADRRQMLAAAQKAFPGLKINDTTRVNRAVANRAAWMRGVEYGFRQLAHLTEGKASLEDDGFSIEGLASSSEAYGAARREIRALPTELKLRQEKIAAPTAKPFVWTAELMPGELVLAGFAPSERVREEVLADARRRFRSARINDQRLLIASGAPADWQKASAVALEQLARLDRGRVLLSDASLTLEGEAIEETTAEAVSRTVKSQVPAGWRAVEKISFQKPKIKVVSPYTTGAVLAGGVLVLSGHFPSEDGRQKLLAAARRILPNARLDDRMALAAGEPPGWQQCLEAGLRASAALGSARFDLTDRRAVLAAEAASEQQGNEARELVRAAQPACTVDPQIKVAAQAEPDLSWSAQWTGSELVLEGEVPDKGTQALLLEEARRAFANARIVDRMKIASGRPDDWQRAAREGLLQLAKLVRGEARISARTLQVTGVAGSYLVADAVHDALASHMPRGYLASEAVEVRQPRSHYEETEAQIERWWRARKVATAPAPTLPPPPQTLPATPPPVPPPPAVQQPAVTPLPVTRPAVAQPQVAVKTEADRCQELLSQTRQEGTIAFDRAKATLQAASFPTLDKIAQVLGTCPALVVDIEGHTDSDGTNERNERLSEERAAAVVAYLAGKGVKIDRLHAVGFGARQPVASNDTPENKAKNRRIEFVIRKR